MSDYDGIPFAVGSIRGFRRWKVGVEGILKPVSMSGDWHHGENLAACQCHPNADQMPRIEGENWKDQVTRANEWRAQASFDEMKCGFYAYFDGEDERGHGSDAPHISGVIEGYGEVLIGTKGFRAKRARILALAIPAFNGIWSLEDLVVRRIQQNYPNIPIIASELVMRAEYPAPAYKEEVDA